MIRYTKRFTFLFLLILLFIVACRKDLNKISTTRWQPELTLPFIQTELRLGDILPQDSNLLTLPDSSLYYAYHQDSVFSLSADSLLNLLNNALDTNYIFSLGELAVDSFNISASYSMLDALPYLEPAVRDTLLKYDKSENIFPPFSYSTPFPIELSPIELYEHLTFSHGFIVISATNSLPVPLQNISFSLKDDANGVVLKTISIETLDPGEVLADTLQLQGLTLGNRFSFVVNSFSSNGSFPDSVFIDLNQGLNFSFRAQELFVVNGAAKISRQIMYSDLKTIDLSTASGEKLYQVIFSGGHLNYVIQSELSVRAYVELKLPSGLINGVIPHADINLNANSTFNNSWDLENMQLYLNSDTLQSYNRFPVYIGITILPTTEMVSFDSADRVLALFTTESIKPSYAEGYFGKKEFTITKDTLALNFGFFQKLQGEIILDNPVMQLTYHNGFGIPIKIFPDFLSINSESGNSVNLGLDSITLQYPKNTGEVANATFQIDKTNSEIVDFLTIRPDKITYSGEVSTNWNSDTLNFIYDTSTMIAGINLHIPLVLRSTNLQLVDTLKLTTTGEKIPFQHAAFKALLENGFPFAMHLVFQLTDSISGQLLQTMDLGKIAAAPVNVNGKVIHSVKDSLFIDLDDLFFDHLKRANRGIFRAETSTFSGGSVPVGLYSDYRLKIAIGFTAAIKP